ncbi:hypothetical protein CGJ94_26370, partial [Vibrio parahaemolyticus]
KLRVRSVLFQAHILSIKPIPSYIDFLNHMNIIDLRKNFTACYKLMYRSVFQVYTHTQLAGQ